MKIAKKSLSLFLSIIMIITSCSVGIFGISVFATDMPALLEDDGSYTADEVKALLATAALEYDGNGLTNAENTLAYEGKYSMIAAADAVVSYAMQNCHTKYSSTATNNTGVTLAAAVISKLGITDGTQKSIINAIFDPAGDTVFSYYGSYPTISNESTSTLGGNKSTADSSMYAWKTGSFTGSGYSQGQVITDNSSVAYDSADSDENITSCVADLEKSTTIILSNASLNDMLLTYDSIDDIPAEIVTKIRFEYSYGTQKYAYIHKISGTMLKTNWYAAFKWNYLESVESRIIGKNKKIKKQLTNFEKAFNDKVTSLTLEEMLTYDAATLESLYGFAKSDLTDMQESIYSEAVLKKFCHYDKAVEYVDNLYFAYRVKMGMKSIDILVENSGKKYDKTNYSEMASLYTTVNTAYNFVVNIDSDILGFVKTEYAGYEEKYSSLDLAATKTYLDVLYADMRLQLLKDTYAAVYDIYTSVHEYYYDEEGNVTSSKTMIDVVADTNNLDDIETIELIGLSQKVAGYNAVLNTYDVSSINEVFPEGHYDAWKEFCDKLAAKLEVRGVEDDFETYYEYYIPLLYANYAALDNDDVMSMYADFDENLQNLKDAYAEYSAKYDSTTIKRIFTIKYNDKDQLLQEAVTSALLPALQENIILRNNIQLQIIENLEGMETIDFSNYDDVKAIISPFDQDLYDFVNEQGWLTTDAAAIYAGIMEYKAAYDKFVASGGKDAFKSNIDEDGIYAERYAGDQTVKVEEDGEINEVQLGYPNDIARDNEDKDNDGVADDNYTVSRDEMSETIVKIDNFIISRDFGALIGLTDEETGEYTTLGATIESLFENLLYSPDIFNMLMSVFPMLCGLLEDMLPELIYDNCGGLEPQDSNATARVDLSSMGLSGLTGDLDVYLNLAERDGERNQVTFLEVTEELGLYIYPSSMAYMLWDAGVITKRDPIYSALKEADNDWKKFEGYDAATETYKFEYEWDVYDYDSFIMTIGGFLECISPLLPTVFLDQDFSGTGTDAGYAYGSFGYSVLSLSGNGAYGDLIVDVKALNLYNKLFIPLFEALGIGGQGFIDYTYPTLTTKSSGEDFAKAIFDPVMALLDAVVKAPLTTVLKLLPNLIYFLSMDFVDSFIQNDFMLDFSVTLHITHGDDGIARLLSLINAFYELKFELYGDQLTFADFGLGNSMYDILGFEITSLNSIVKYVLSLLEDINLKLPSIEQEQLLFASTWTTYTSANGTQRVYLKADEVQVLYVILNFVVKALGQEGFLDGLLGDSVDGAIKELIHKVASNVHYNQDGALAAIMEILVPNTDANGDPEYELEEMDWVTKGEYTYDGIEGASQMSIVYLNYGNDWTKADSEYIINNVDEIVAAVLEMTGSDIESLNAYLADMVNGLFANDLITKLVEMLGSFGDSPSGIILDIFQNQLEVDIAVWFDAFGYLFPAETWADDAVIIAPGEEGYSTTFANVTATADEEGNITWYYDGEALADGDKQMFINIFCELAQQLEIVISFLFGGGDIGVFNDLVKIQGYESYATTLGVLFETLGIENLPTQAQVSADPIEGLRLTLTAVADWFDALVESDNMIETVLEIIPDLFYYIESNGLGTLIHNILMPVLVIVDDVRPLIDVNLNMVLSLIVSEFLNYGKIDFNVVLEFLAGVYTNDNLDYKWYNIDINNLKLSELIKLVDVYFGTDLYNSGLVQIGVKGFCSGIVPYDSVSGTGYRTTVDAADALTLLLTAVIDCLAYPAQDKSKTNGDVILEFIAEMTENEDIADIYNVVMEVIAGVDFEYAFPNWGYMFTDPDATLTASLPEHTIVYLGYNTNWTKEAADSVYDALDDILELVLPSVLEEGQTLKTLIDGLLAGNVYTDEILNTVVELLVNLLADFDTTLLDLVDCVVATDITEWFKFCEEVTTEVTDEETGEVTTETEWVCTYDWNIDAQETTEAKKDAFIEAICEVLAPANELLAWLFFGADYDFFTSSKVDAEGNYTYADLINLNGGKGYAFGLVPILEALGCEMQPADNFYVMTLDGTATYNVSAAVGGLLESVLALVDDICEDPIAGVFDLIPNLLYFINADGVKTSVNNLLAPVDGILEKLTPIIGEEDEEGNVATVSIAGLLEESIGFDISDITMDTVLGLIDGFGVVLTDEMAMILKTFYLGELAEFDSANGYKAYRMVYTEDENEADFLTILISFALDLLVINEELFAPLFGEETYKTIVDFFEITESKVMQKYGWLYVEYADTDKEFNATETSVKYSSAYNNIWSRDKAEYIADNLVPFASNILGLIGLEINGVEIRSVDDLLDSLLEGNLYTQEMADTILDLLKSIPELFGEYADLGEMAINIIDNAIGTSLGSWATMEVTVENGNRESFVAALEQMLAPVVPLLDVLLCDEDLSFFYSVDETVVITIPGSQGYDYGIIPLFEALGCEMMTPAEFYALDDEAKIGAILDSLLDRVDVILADPVNEIFAMIPELTYFINSNGLDTAVKNIINTVDTVLAALEPLLGAPDLMTLLGLDLAEYNMDYLVNLACDAIADSTGLDVEPLIVDFVAELTMGKVISYQSANGETYYKMVYAGENQFADMITVLIRLAVDWLATGDNADAIIALLQGNAESEDAANSSATLVKAILQGLNTEPSLSGAMATVYYIFYGLNNAAEGLDTLYGNYGNSWDSLLNFFEETDDNNYDKLTDFLKNVIKEFGGVEVESTKDNCDCDCHSSSGFIRFFWKIANFFRRLFGMKDYQYCDCGEAHW